MDDSTLLALRSEIDTIDAQIVELLARRFDITNQVGVLKARNKLNAIDPEREAQQAQHYVALAGEFGVKPALVQQLFRGIIDEVVSNHRAIAIQSAFQ